MHWVGCGYLPFAIPSHFPTNDKFQKWITFQFCPFSDKKEKKKTAYFFYLLSSVGLLILSSTSLLATSEMYKQLFWKIHGLKFHDEMAFLWILIHLLCLFLDSYNTLNINLNALTVKSVTLMTCFTENEVVDKKSSIFKHLSDNNQCIQKKFNSNCFSIIDRVDTQYKSIEVPYKIGY